MGTMACTGAGAGRRAHAPFSGGRVSYLEFCVKPNANSAFFLRFFCDGAFRSHTPIIRGLQRFGALIWYFMYICMHAFLINAISIDITYPRAPRRPRPRQSYPERVLTSIRAHAPARPQLQAQALRRRTRPHALAGAGALPAPAPEGDRDRYQLQR